MAELCIQNETAARLTLAGAEGETITLAPLQGKELEDTSAFDFEHVERDGIVSTERRGPQEVAEKLAVWLLGGGFWYVVICVVIDDWTPPFSLSPGLWKPGVWIVGLLLLLIGPTILIVRSTGSGLLILRLARQVVSLVAVLTIGVGLPAATIYFFGDGRALLAGEPTPSATSPESAEASGPSLALFARLLQLAFIAVASLLPALLYFLFDRFQLGTLRRRLYRHIFRLDPSVDTINDIHAKYGYQIQEAYGTDPKGRGRLAPGTRWPILVCALVVTIGWILALVPVGTAGSLKSGADAVGLLMPERTALVFGFLGAYFFSVRLIVTQYARGDLKPKAYSHVVVRIIVVAVLSWVLGALFGAESVVVLGLAFVFGLMPDSFFVWLKEFMRKTKVSPALTEASGVFPEPTKLPLTQIEGIDLYDRGRLENEGIANVEGLAHHEVIDLVIETRLPVPRIVDWIDQSILLLHLIGCEEQESARKKLREYGIRTATDLLEAWRAAGKRGGTYFRNFKKILGPDAPPYRLEVIRDTMLDDEWMDTVRSWRRNHTRREIHRSVLPTSSGALERWADKQVVEQRFGRALSLYKDAIAVQDDARVRRKIAKLLAGGPVAQLRNSKEAGAHADRAYMLAPQDYEGLLELAEIHLEIEDHATALRMCGEAEQQVDKLRGARKTKEQERVRKLVVEIQERQAAGP